jgi:hypothetical protein
MSETSTQTPVVLEEVSQEFVEATASPRFLNELTLAEPPVLLDEVQVAPLDELPIHDRRPARGVQLPSSSVLAERRRLFRWQGEVSGP